MPMIAGLINDAIPNVENTAPISEPLKCKTPPRYPPIEISHAPQTKNCKKLKMVKRNLIDLSSVLVS